MRANLDCIYCIIQKADSRYGEYENDNRKKLEFMKKVFTMLGKSQNDATAPYLSKCVNDLLRDEFRIKGDYAEIKDKYNQLVMALQEEIEDAIRKSDDVLLTALKYAMAGNFIDFGAMDDVKDDELYKVIDSVNAQRVDCEQYRAFQNDLDSAKHLVYLLDNSGEIVFDKIFIKFIKSIYPDINITAVVRGNPVFNDATMKDAEDTGLCSIVEMIGNGTDIPGTQLDRVNAQTLKAIDNADLIISKGQGNFETLYGCGKNIYYIFLCKCDLFVRRFGLERFSGVFATEKDLNFNH